VNNSRVISLLALLVGVVLVAVAVIYWVDTAKALPSFFPGHDAKSTTHHVKHGVAALAVGLACFAFAWFQSGPKQTAASA
jgi:hypothetical protein